MVILRRSGKGLVHVEGLMALHVDDFLWACNKAMRDIIVAIGQELGLGSVEGPNEVGDMATYDGRQITLRSSSIKIPIGPYTEGLQPVVVGRARRQTPDAALSTFERRSFDKAVGQLLWLVSRLRADQSYELAMLQREKSRVGGPTVGSLMMANTCIRSIKKKTQLLLENVTVGAQRLGFGRCH